VNLNLSSAGFSFKSAEKYLNNDKRLEGDDPEQKVTTRTRVAWTSTRNLMTDDPTVATKIMIATALNAERLKQEAGGKSTGRKSARHVQTLSLAWHPDETVTREEMEQAADEIIEILELTDHHVVIFCHSDTAHPHIHLLINRVHPDTGRMAVLSNAKRNLDSWAQKYEERRDNIVSPNRDAKYRRMEKAKKHYPDVNDRRAWAIKKRKEAADKSPIKPKSERWGKLKAAETKGSALRATNDRHDDLAAKVPLDRQEAAEQLLRPLVGFQETSSLQNKITAAVFAHDPELDVRGLLERNLPRLRSSADPREVFNRLDKDYKAWTTIESEILNDPEMEAAFNSLSGTFMAAANVLRDTSWVTVERNIRKSFGQRVAETIRRAVDFLANLFREEKIAKLEKPPETPIAGGAEQPKAPAPPAAPDYGGNY